jgi:excisionase family DNA binding protein
VSHEKILLNTRELAAMTGFSEGTLRHWVSERRLPVVRLSARCVRFRLSDIEAWLAGKVIAPDGSAGIRTNEMGGARTVKKVA